MQLHYFPLRNKGSPIRNMTPQENDRRCGFNTLFEKSMPHILENIFFSLDYKSFKACSEVSIAWNQLFSSETYRRKAKKLLTETDEFKKEAERLKASETYRRKAKELLTETDEFKKEAFLQEEERRMVSGLTQYSTPGTEEYRQMAELGRLVARSYNL